MKTKNKAFIPLIIFCASCVPQAFPIPQYAKTIIKFNGNFDNVDKLQVNIKDPNCVDIDNCRDVTYNIDKKDIPNGISVVPGTKTIIIRRYKDNQLINEQTENNNAILGKELIVEIRPLTVSTPSPVNTPEPTPIFTSNPTPVPSQSGNSVVINPTPTATITVSPTPTPSPTPSYYVGTSGGGGLIITPTPTATPTLTPDIQVSATVNPDNIGVK